MTRPFRLEEDERRYFALRSEFFVRLAQSGVPTQTVHEIMRNFGKLEDFAFFEGVRQGMAAAFLAPETIEDAHDLDALEVHARIYGAASTPLARRERDVAVSIGTIGIEDEQWLDTEPLQFGPLTLTEALEQLGPDLQVNPPPPRKPVAVPAFDPERSPGMTDLMVSPKAIEEVFDAEAALERLANGEDPALVLGSLGQEEDIPPVLQDLIEEPLDDQPIQRPALLDRIRDILTRLDAPPPTWTDLILMLMRETRHDASYLDDLMSTPMGMTVISQANLFHLHPGAMPEIKRTEPG